MSQEYEYRFVRLDKRAKKNYEQTVKELARDGWRLVQSRRPRNQLRSARWCKK
jgi:hypothetical protein